MRLLAGLLLGIVAAAAAPAATASAPAPAAPCAATSLRATFTHIAGSEGAGNVAYQLTFVNHGRHTCSLGRPTIVLLGRSGTHLPSHSTSSGGRVNVRPGRKATAPVRFTADIAAPNEHQTFPCEPLAYSVSVTFAGSPGRAVGPVRPPIPVCQHGGMEIRPLTAP
jgi:hypothetical protein